MATCTVCPLCEQPKTLQQATEIAQVPCNVRRLRDHQFTVWRCSNCNSLHSYEDADLGFYYKHFPFQRHQLDFATRIGYKNRLRLLQKRGLSKTHTILDYGCGAGLFVDFLRESGYANAFGYDAYVERHADTSVLNQKYDAVVSYDVIEHVDSPREFMRAIERLVRIGGLLAIGTPEADNIPLNDGNVLAAELSQPYHRHLLSERVLLTLAAENGMVAEHTHRRFYMDSLVPGVNSRFIWSYIAATGGMIDAAVEPPRMGVILRSPKLIFNALFGYFLPPRGNILITFRKVKHASTAHDDAERYSIVEA